MTNCQLWTATSTFRKSPCHAERALDGSRREHGMRVLTTAAPHHAQCAHRHSWGRTWRGQGGRTPGRDVGLKVSGQSGGHTPAAATQVAENQLGHTGVPHVRSGLAAH